MTNIENNGYSKSFVHDCIKMQTVLKSTQISFYKKGTESFKKVT